MSEIIKIRNLVKRYKNLVALDHLNLEIEEGEIFGLLGPNGSGKTTCINCILSLLTYDMGEILVFGKPLNPDSYEAKRKIGVVFQNVAVFEKLSVKENIDYFCGLYIKNKGNRKKLVEEAIDFVGLNDYRRMKPNQLSGGLLRRLNIACGIAHKPQLILLDEPTVAVDPQSRNQILEGIKKLNREGATIIYTSHYMEEVELICTRIGILDHGRCIALGTNEELKDMINIGEKITIEGIKVTDKQLKDIKAMENILEATYSGENLSIISKKSETNLAAVINYMQDNGIHFGRVYTERPTLNDVFLELTGTKLRD